MKSNKLVKQIFASLTVCALASASAFATPVFEQGFETDTAGWSDGGNYGSIERLASGTNGINAFEGGFYAQFSQSSYGSYTFWDGSRDVFPGDYYAQTAIYLDTSWNLGSGFDYSMASYNTSDSHLRDFIFHVTKDTSTGDLLVGGSNNTNFDPREDLENLNSFVVQDSGWYIFEHLFTDDAGTLSVDLNLRDDQGNLLFTETRNNLSDTIPSIVGGNGYAWFTNIDIDGGIAVDGTSLNVRAEVPEPASLAMFGLGLLGLSSLRKRRK